VQTVLPPPTWGLGFSAKASRVATRSESLMVAVLIFALMGLYSDGPPPSRWRWGVVLPLRPGPLWFAGQLASARDGWDEWGERGPRFWGTGHGMSSWRGGGLDCVAFRRPG